MGLGFNIGMDIHRGGGKETRFRPEQNLDCEELVDKEKNVPSLFPQKVSTSKD